MRRDVLNAPAPAQDEQRRRDRDHRGEQHPGPDQQHHSPVHACALRIASPDLIVSSSAVSDITNTAEVANEFPVEACFGCVGGVFQPEWRGGRPALPESADSTGRAVPGGGCCRSGGPHRDAGVVNIRMILDHLVVYYQFAAAVAVA